MDFWGLWDSHLKIDSAVLFSRDEAIHASFFGSGPRPKMPGY